MNKAATSAQEKRGQIKFMRVICPRSERVDEICSDPVFRSSLKHRSGLFCIAYPLS